MNEGGGGAWLDDVADFYRSSGGDGGIPGFGGESVFRGRGAAGEFRVPDVRDFAERVELHFPSADWTGGCVFKKNLHLRSGSPITDELLGDGEHASGRSRRGAGSGRWAW